MLTLVHDEEIGQQAGKVQRRLFTGGIQLLAIEHSLPQLSRYLIWPYQVDWDNGHEVIFLHLWNVMAGND